MKTLLLAAASAAVLALGVAAPASAASQINLDGSVTLDATDPFSFPVIVSGATAGDFDPLNPLSARINLRYLGTADNQTFNFSYDLHNTTPLAGNPDSRIVTFGFDITGGPTVSADSTPYDTNDDPGNFNGLGSRDVCFSTGNNNCNGGGGLKNGSVVFGVPLLNGTFSLTYGASQSTLLMENFAVRFQSTGSLGLDSASGPGIAIPEPATWAMMIGGFGLIGAAMRRKRSARAVLA